MLEKIQAIIFRKKDSDFEFLILKRTPELGGFWQFVSGTCEDSDSDLEFTLFREVKEEVGLDKEQILSLTPDLNKFEFVDTKGNNCLEYVFGVETNPDFKVNTSNNVYVEHSEWKWCSFEEAYELNEHQHNKDTLKEFYELLQEIK